MAVFDNITGISVASGFKLQAKSALDPRLVVDTIEDRDALITENGAYEGMTVYVKADKKKYTLKGTTNSDWVEDGSDVSADLGDLTGRVDDIEEQLDGTAKFTQEEKTKLAGLKNYTHPEAERSDTTSTQTATHGGTVVVVDGVTSDDEGHITAINKKTVTLPAAPTSVSGNAGTASNAFRVTYSGNVYGKASFHSSGADYAEFFEWQDGNTHNDDRRGLFVALDGNKIKIAQKDDEVIGVVSSMSSVVGNSFEDDWQGKYLTDIYGKPLSQIVHHDAEYREIDVEDIDDNGEPTGTTHKEQQLINNAYDSEEYIINPEYDPDLEYKPRSERPEWSVVGMFGQLVVIDDGSCEVNKYCTVGSNGTATTADKGYRVLKRLDDTHVKILFK